MAKVECAVPSGLFYARAHPSCTLSDRRAFESLMATHSSNTIKEVILIDDQLRFYEGLTTNFAVLKRGLKGQLIIQTAGSNVLEGTVISFLHELTMKVPWIYSDDTKNNVSFVMDFSFPVWEERELWIGAFICSWVLTFDEFLLLESL